MINYFATSNFPTIPAPNGKTVLIYKTSDFLKRKVILILRKADLKLKITI